MLSLRSIFSPQHELLNKLFGSEQVLRRRTPDEQNMARVELPGTVCVIPRKIRFE